MAQVSDPRREKKRKRAERRGAAPQDAGVSTSKRAELVIDCRYANELPKPPVPKLLRALPSVDKLCQYAPTSLELDHRPFLLSERMLLSRMELLHPDAYGELPARGAMAPPAPPKDAQLLRDDDVSAEIKEAEAKRRRLTEKTEAWHRQAFALQLPQLITNDVFTERQRFTTGLEAAEKKLIREAPGFDSVQELASKIEKTFEEAKVEPVHPTKKSMKAKRVMSIVPDAVLWATRYRQIVFDELPTDPVPKDLLFRSAPTPRITCFGYFKPQDEGDNNQYKLAENYIWENKGGFTRQSDVGEGDSMLLSIPPAGEERGEVRFVTVPSFLKLKKQRATRLDIDLETKNLTVSYREPSAREAAEEQTKLNSVMNDEPTREGSEASLEFVDGEWQIRGDPRTESGRSRVEGSRAEASAEPSPAGRP